MTSLALIILVAQAPTLTSVKVDAYKSSAPSVSVGSLTVSVVPSQCNQGPTTLQTPLINPTQLEFDDFSNPGRVCRVNVSQLVNSLPPEDYVVKAESIYSDGTNGGTSLPSNPFTRFLYRVITGLKLIKP